MRLRSGGRWIGAAPRRATMSSRSPAAALPPLPGAVRLVAAMIAHVDAARARRAERRQLAILQEAQQLDLRLAGHLADLVEEQRAPLGLLDQAGLGLVGGRVRALPVAEQLALHQLARDRARS